MKVEITKRVERDVTITLSESDANMLAQFLFDSYNASVAVYQTARLIEFRVMLARTIALS